MSIEQTVVINTDTKSLADLRKEISSIQSQLDLTPKGTKEYDSLVVRLREAKGELKDFKETTKGLDPDQRAAKLVNAFQGMTGAIQSAAGAVTLFGGSSESLEKVEKNLLGIIAIGGGIQSTIEGYNDAVDVIGPKLRDLGSTIKGAFTTASGAVNGLKVAFAGLGIGLVIALATTLVNTFKDVSEETKKAKEEQDKYNRSLRDLQIERIELEKGEKAALEAKLADAEATKAANDAILEQGKIREKVIEDAKKLNIDAVDSNDKARRKNEEQLRLSNAKLENDIIRYNNRIKAIDQAAKNDAAARQKVADDKDKERRDKIRKDNLDRAKNEAEAIRNLNEVERQYFLEQEQTDADRANREFTNTLERLEEQKQEELNQLNLTEIAKQAIRDKYNKLEKLAEQKNADDIAKIQAAELDKILNNTLQQIQDDFEEVENLESALYLEKASRKEAESRDAETRLKRELDKIDALYSLNRNAIQETIKQTVDPDALKKLNEQLLALDEKYNQDRSDAFKQGAKNIVDAEELKAQKIKELNTFVYEQARETAEQLNNLADVRATNEKNSIQTQIKSQVELAKARGASQEEITKIQEEGEAQLNEINKKAFERQQKFAIATALIDTYLAAQKAYTSQIIPGDPSSIVRATIAAGVAVVAGLSKVAVIAAQKFDGTGGGAAGGGGGSVGTAGGGSNILNPFSTQGGGVNVLPPRLAPPSGGGQQGTQAGTDPTLGQTPIVRAYVLAGDVTEAVDAEARLNQKRKL